MFCLCKMYWHDTQSVYISKHGDLPSILWPSHKKSLEILCELKCHCFLLFYFTLMALHLREIGKHPAMWFSGDLATPSAGKVSSTHYIVVFKCKLRSVRMVAEWESVDCSTVTHGTKQAFLNGMMWDFQLGSTIVHSTWLLQKLTDDNTNVSPVDRDL